MTAPLRFVLALFALAALSAGCRRPVGATLPPRTQCRGQVLGIGPRDVLTVTVFNETNFTGDYRVGEEGSITYPYLGRVRVTNLQAGELADMLRLRLGEDNDESRAQAAELAERLRSRLGGSTPDDFRGRNILRDPTVRVEVREINSRRISVFGQVQHPGVFPHQQCLTLTQAIALAGGFTALAEKNTVRVTRIVHDPAGGADTRRTFVLRAEDIAEGRTADFDLLPDDVIFVAESLT